MSDSVWITIIVGLFNLAAIIVSRVMSRGENRATEVKVEEVHKATNSIVAQLLATTKTEAHAAGVKEEKERNR